MTSAMRVKVAGEVLCRGVVQRNRWLCMLVARRGWICDGALNAGRATLRDGAKMLMRGILEGDPVVHGAGQDRQLKGIQIARWDK
jgi:hypothetical protein